MITSVQLRAGRGAVGLKKVELARICGLNPATIHRFENQTGFLQGNSDSVHRIMRALEDRGVVFIKGGVILREDPKIQPTPKLAEAS